VRSIRTLHSAEHHVCDSYSQQNITNTVWKWYIVKHNGVTKGIFSDHSGQLHVSACTGHLQVVLGELNLRSYYKHSARTWCRDLYIRALFAKLKLLCGGVLGRYDGSVAVRRPAFRPSPRLGCVVGARMAKTCSCLL